MSASLLASITAALLAAQSSLGAMQMHTPAPVTKHRQHTSTRTYTPPQSTPSTSTQSPAPSEPVQVIPTQPTSNTSSSVSQIEGEVLRLTNEERTSRGLSALEDDSPLAAIARAHSADMLSNNYFSHTNRSGCSASCRMTNAGYSWQAMGENIHMMQGYHLSATDTAQKIVTDWMNSAGHRANILNTSFTHAGIGIATDGDRLYTTADYSLPR